MNDTSSNMHKEIQKMLASSIHETLKLIPSTHKLGYIGECLRLLMSSGEKEVRECLAKNLDLVIAHYVKDKDFERLMLSVAKSQTAAQLG